MKNDEIISQLRTLLTGPSFDVIEQIASDLQRKWAWGNVKRNTNCDTVYELGKKDGRIEGVRLFFQELRKKAQDND